MNFVHVLARTLFLSMILFKFSRELCFQSTFSITVRTRAISPTVTFLRRLQYFVQAVMFSSRL